MWRVISWRCTRRSRLGVLVACHLGAFAVALRLRNPRYGLLAPQQVIGPGEHALHGLPAAERACWAERIAAALHQRLARSASPHTFVLYAGQRTADLLVRAAPELDVELPLNGLGLRQRLQWYDDRLQVRSRMLSRGPVSATVSRTQ